MVSSLDRFQRREDLYFEAKSAPRGIPNDFWETYSSFANTFGGTIVLGLSEDEEGNLVVTGVDDPSNTVKILWDNLNNPRFVNVNLLRDRDVSIEEMDGRKIIVVRVPAAERHVRPVYIRNNINSGTFKRNHEGDYHCRVDEIKAMIRDSADTTTDLVPIDSLGMDCLDQSTISRYLNELRSYKSNHIWCSMPQEEFLQLSGVARMVNGNLRPTGAGLLMFGKVSYIRQVFNGFFLDYTEKGIGERYHYRIHSNSGDWSGNIYDFVLEVMNRVSRVLGAPFELRGFSNAGYSESYLAVREAILNALIHADYHLTGGVVIRMMPSAVMVSNPGTMRVRLTDAMNGGLSDPRNNGLMALAMAVGWVERLGSGIYSMEMIKERGGISSLSITETADPSSVKVEIGLGTGSDSGMYDQRRRKILEAVSRDPGVSRAELADSLGISVRSLSDILRRMREEGSLERVGGNKAGSWRILRND